jgi:hypothetical protein
MGHAATVGGTLDERYHAKGTAMRARSRESFRPRAMRPRAARTARRGIASVLAMLYLMLFSVMAVGFYAATTMAAQVANNEQRMAASQMAAESGMSFLRYEMGQVSISGVTNDSQVLQQAYGQLKARMNGTGNLGYTTYAVGYDGTQITIPDDTTAFVEIETGGPRFRVVITRDQRDLIATVIGRGGPSGYPDRAIQLRYHINERPSPIWGYGVAMKGPLTVSSGNILGVPVAARGSVLSDSTSATPVVMSGNGTISGSVDLTSSTATVSGGTNTTIGGQPPATWASMIHTGVPKPEFPTVDPTPFVNYLVGKQTVITASVAGGTLSNIRIKAGTNPSFSAGVVIQGVVLIEAPNQVSFAGGTVIQGVIVTDNIAEATTTNSITFSGGVTLQGVETLPASFGDLRTMGGASILAPNFTLNMSGGASSLGGSVVVKSATLSGGATGTVNGTMISMSTAATTWSGGAGFTITNSTASAKPTGVRFTGNFWPVGNSYAEVATP